MEYIKFDTLNKYDVSKVICLHFHVRHAPGSYWATTVVPWWWLLCLFSKLCFGGFCGRCGTSLEPQCQWQSFLQANNGSKQKYLITGRACRDLGTHWLHKSIVFIYLITFNFSLISDLFHTRIRFWEYGSFICSMINQTMGRKSGNVFQQIDFENPLKDQVKKNKTTFYRTNNCFSKTTPCVFLYWH